MMFTKAIMIITGVIKHIENRRPGVPRRVVTLLVEARVVGDVDHPRAADKAAIAVDHW